MRNKTSSNKAIIILSFILLLIVVAIVVIVFYLRGNGEKGVNKQIGKIYYQVTPEEHISSSNGILYADNELLVVIKDGVPKQEVEFLAKDYNAKIVGCIEVTGDYQWVLEEVYSIDEIGELADRLKNEDIVVQVSPNYLFELSENSIDYNINTGKKWKGDLKNSTDNKGKSWGVEAINAPAAWSLMDEHKADVNPVHIGVIDNGFDDSHEDLSFTQVFYNDTYNNAQKGKKAEIGGHGTHVTGTFAANGNDDEGICGVYPYAQESGLYGATWNNYTEHSENTFGSTISQRICFAELILRNVRVINCSYGFEDAAARLAYYQEINDETEFNNLTTSIDYTSYLLADFLSRLIENGYDYVIVVAAGNDSNKEFSITINDEKIKYKTGRISADTASHLARIPRDFANYNEEYKDDFNKTDYSEVYNRIIVVGAIDNNFNECSFSNGGDRVDVYAPGKNIYSTVPVSKYENGEKWSGTSMAAPHVAGVAASVWSRNNGFSGPVIKNIICQALNVDYCALPVIDMASAIQIALSTGQNATLDSDQPDANNGSIMGFVVDKDNYSVTGKGIETGAISDAEIKSVNNENHQMTIVKTDFSGHFELVLPPGQYTLTVNAIGYEPYTWLETINVEGGQVHDLSDWIKLTLHDTAETSETATESDTGTTSAPRSQTYWVIFDEGFRNDRLELSTFTVAGNATRVYGVWNGNLIQHSDGGTVSSCKQYHYDSDWVYDRNYSILTDKANKIYASNFSIYDSNGKLIISPSDSLADEQIKAIKEKKNSLNQQNISQIVGTYKGQYTAGQGDTGLTLSIYKTSDVVKSQTIRQRLADIATECSNNSEGIPQKEYNSEEIKSIVQQHSGEYIAFFYYYPLSSNPDVEDGLYTMSVDYDPSTGYFSLIGETWIQRETYVFVDLNNVYVENGEMFGTWDLDVVKQ